MLTGHAFQEFALRVAPPTAAVANYCDHVEHNEIAKATWVLDAGGQLRELACGLSAAAGLPALELYAERLGEIEARNVLMRPGGYDGHRAALEAETWRDVQLVQIDHDRAYHLDVLGLTKSEQLRHYALHLTKIVGAFAQPRDEHELLRRRLPDVLLFGIKLATVMGARLDDKPVAAAVPTPPAAEMREHPAGAR
jgi:hypothetical protein